MMRLYDIFHHSNFNYFLFKSANFGSRSYAAHCISSGDVQVKIRHRSSKVFQPVVAHPVITNASSKEKTEAFSKSHQLMLDHGLIRHSYSGTFHYLPLAVKSLNKLIRIIDEEMEAIGGQKVDLPCLISKQLWKTTERWDALGDELFKLKDRHERDLCLGPTHEEVITDLMATASYASYKNMPILLYQIAKKYRDEMKPRFGLLRAREFLMKDLYSFDATEEDAKRTYETVGNAYKRLLNRLGLKFVQVEADSGKIGGKISHEFHLISNIGEDRVVFCKKCTYSANADFLAQGSGNNCKLCGSQLESKEAIEVAHTFLLGTKYSAPLKAHFVSTAGKKENIIMGCYGVGVSRLLAASLEVLSTNDQLRWPNIITPYKFCVIPPKANSNEIEAEPMAEHIYNELNKLFPDDVIYDDRNNKTIGSRLFDAKKIGYPYIIIVGKTVLESVPKFEMVDLFNNSTMYVTHNELFQLANQIKF
ncbi:prolyl-tRNA synthetase [Chamberlinius hualienensis]